MYTARAFSDGILYAIYFSGVWLERKPRRAFDFTLFQIRAFDDDMIWTPDRLLLFYRARARLNRALIIRRRDLTPSNQIPS